MVRGPNLPFCFAYLFLVYPVAIIFDMAHRPARGRPDPTSLLLASGLGSEEVAGLLSSYALEEPKRADANLQSMAGDPRSRRMLADILEELLEAVARTADPDQALIHWERFLQVGPNRSQLFQYLAGAPRILHLLCAIFGNSPSLSQTLIRDPLLVYWLAEEEVLSRGPARGELQRALRAMLSNVKDVERKLDILRRFKRREMLRIGIRDLMRSARVQQTTAALSDLAAVLIQAAYEVVQGDLGRQYGTPFHRDPKGVLGETGFTVMAMGKLGGGELNYSSDVDVIFVYASDDGRTRSTRSARKVRSIPNEEYFEYMARSLTKALTEHTQEGSIFRVDLRLRAEGSVGQLARPLTGYEQYYRTRGQGWERQALLKAWPVAGDPAVGRTFLRMVKPFIFEIGQREATAPPGSDVIEQIKGIKAMIDDKIAGRGHEHRNVKLGTGGIREIEFVVQAVQMIGGRRIPGILDRNTMKVLGRFRRHGVLSQEAGLLLEAAYLFLRNVEHKLQMVHDLQTHALPDDPTELSRCAVRLGYASYSDNREAATTSFVKDLRHHTTFVHHIFKQLIETPRQSPLLQAVVKRGG